MSLAGPPFSLSLSLSLCRLAPSSTCRIWLGRGHEGDHHRGPQFTDCVRMVHFMRNALSRVPKAAQQMVGATIRTVFAQPDSEGAREQWLRVSEGFDLPVPETSELMNEAEEDVLSYSAFPQEHWQKIWSNNPLERVNKEVKRRTNVVGIFPTEGSVIRLVGSVLRAARRVASLKTLLQRWIFGEAGAKGGQMAQQPQLVAS